MVLAKDERNRPEVSAESLAKLNPAFREDVTPSAWNRVMAPGRQTRTCRLSLPDGTVRNGVSR